jgi:hypothetical protein
MHRPPWRGSEVISRASLCLDLLPVGDARTGHCSCQSAQPPALEAQNTESENLGFRLVCSRDFGKRQRLRRRYDYIFTNVGNAVLEINGVRPACSCTAAGDWFKTVEPGKTGTIPL